ncbi:MAG: uroporphyrinogen decarboxylase family protein [Candidatus Bathyarchaeia archaeon]
MNRLDCVIAAYLHEDPEVVPQNIGFVDEVAIKRLAPELLEIQDWRKRALAEARLLDNFSIGCGGGGIRTRVLRRLPDYDLIETELGMLRKRYRLRDLHYASWRPSIIDSKADIRTLHDWTEIVKYPVEAERIEDLEALEFPDPDDPGRYEGLEESVRFFEGLGYMTLGSLNGFFSGVWYELMPFRLWLTSLVRNRSFAKKAAALIGEFNLKVAKNLLERGVHCITWGDDMGYRKGMFFSREVYKDIIWPWHRKAAELAHRYGAFAEMHVDGNINAIMDLIVDAGIDAINNVGPGDNMDLAELKEKYGDRITLHGGLSRFISRMSDEELKSHVINRLAIGSPGGGYILGLEGSIHSDMKPETFRLFLECSRKYRRNKPFL